MIGLIAAVSSDGVIGVDGKLPWRIPEDMMGFRMTTMHTDVIAGWRTAQSIRRKLQGRTCWCISSKLERVPDGWNYARSIEDALAMRTHENAWLIGGAGIYAWGVEHADVMVITHVDRRIEATGKHVTRFPGRPWEDVVTWEARRSRDLREGVRVRTYRRRE